MIHFIKGSELPRAIGIRFIGTYDDEAWSVFISLWWRYVGICWR